MSSDKKKTPVIVQGKNGPYQSTRWKRTSPVDSNTIKTKLSSPITAGDAANNLKTRLTEEIGIPVKSGYIGNLGRFGDDRLWMVWLEGVGTNKSPNTFSVKLGPTDDVASQVELIDSDPDLVRQALLKAQQRDGLNFRDVKDYNDNVIMTASEVRESIEAYIA